jgi:branched-chain amino acid transport system substrate-binding protein
MRISRRTLLRSSAVGFAAATSPGLSSLVLAQNEPIRIGILFDFSGPFAAAGSVASATGAQIAIDLVNERGGVLGKHKIEPVVADSESKADVAINEAERLIDQRNLGIILGIFSSAHAVPLAAKMESHKRILWITTAVATSVLKDRHLTYVFRGQIDSDQYGEASVQFLIENSMAKLGIEPKDLKVAVIHEDGPFGTDIAGANARFAKEHGIPIALKEGYSSSAPDLSLLVIKLKRARPDIILHTGYSPDITLFLRQARELGLRFRMLIGNAAGYSELDKLTTTFGKDIDLFCNVDSTPAQLLDPKTLTPGLGDIIRIMVERYQAKTGAKDVPTHVTKGFNHTWVLLNHVLPIAKEKYGGFEPEAVRRAALDVDIPAGGTIQGHGVKFYPPGTPLSGQNERSTAVVMQYNGGHTTIVWPSKIRTHEPVLPLPVSSPYGMR